MTHPAAPPAAESAIATPPSPSAHQQTLATAVGQSGVGLHSGCQTQVQLLPAPPDQGRCFVRTDLPGAPAIAATVNAVHQTLLSTELQAGDASVRTVEHLLAALAAMGIDNVTIAIDGGEVPLLDGSALPWVELIQQAGVQPQTAAPPPVSVTEPIWVRQGDAFVAALPAPALRFTYGIDFSVPAIGNQWFSWAPGTEADFAQAVAPARTFGLADQIDQLRASGLIQGGSLENALVCDHDRWLNPPLRFENEPARHKMLDLMGDLSLLGRFPSAHFIAYKASHRLHGQLAEAIAAAYGLNGGTV